MISTAVNKIMPQTSEEALADIAVAAKSLRNEMLAYKDKWHFTGDIAFENPTML